MIDREGLEKLAQRRHSGTGNLLYKNDADNIRECWCTDCQRWLTPDEWNHPCSSTRERRKRNRRALLAAGTEGPGLRTAALDLVELINERSELATGFTNEDWKRRLKALRSALAGGPVEGEKK